MRVVEEEKAHLVEEKQRAHADQRAHAELRAYAEQLDTERHTARAEVASLREERDQLTRTLASIDAQHTALYLLLS